MRKALLLIPLAATGISILLTVASSQEWEKTIVIQGDEKPGEPPKFNVQVMPMDRQPMIWRNDMDGEIRQRMNREREMEEMRLNDPEKYKLVSRIDELERSSKETGEKYRSSDDEFEKEALKKKLSDTLNTLFDLKIQLQQLENERLEKELAKKKEILEKRKSQKKEIIELRLNDLLGKNEFLKW